MDARPPGYSRLNTTQFLALRSIAREAWSIPQFSIQWRFNGHWFRLFRLHGVRAPLEPCSQFGPCGYESTFERAMDAAWELEERGLVDLIATRRCCSNDACHGEDRHEIRLTQRGEYLLQRANAISRAQKAVEPARPLIPAPSSTGVRIGWLRRAALRVVSRKVT